MATGGQKESGYNLVDVGTLTLETTDLDPQGIVVDRDMLMITDWYQVHVYRHDDGKLLSTLQLEASPCGICCVNDKEICIALNNGTIKIMSVEDTGVIPRDTIFNLKTPFDACHGVGKFMDKVVVSGVKQNTVCWCVVSRDGHVDKIHNICKGSYMSFLTTTKTNMLYISCWDSLCVYGYNILNPRHKPFTYKHEGRRNPCGISVDDYGYLFVCDSLYDSIYHLTHQCQLVTKYMEGIPWLPFAIFWDHGIFYVASLRSNKITQFKPEYPHQQDPVIPVEILRMDDKSLQLYQKALEDGKEKVYNIRVMVVGQYGVGKTTLTKRLLGQHVDISERKSTEGIDVYKHCFKISVDTGEWIVLHEDSDQLSRLQRLMKLLSGPVQKPDVDITNKNDTAAGSVSDISQLTSSQQPAELSFSKVNQKHGVEHSDQNTSNVAIPVSEAESSGSEKKKDAVMEILHLINKNADKLKKDIVKYAALSLWDFAGQYAFYTTHQTFLTSRAIYLLVIDLSQHITDDITDDNCFLDTEGIKLHKVHDLIEIWLNSINICASSPEASIPVILVGTHVDKLSEDKRQEVISTYFPQICHILKDKPALRHVVTFFAIDNTQLDPQLETLKARIFKLGSEQPHWGEEVPTSWLPMEEALMQLKASGQKVIQRSLVEELNQAASVPIKTAEQLDLFLRFQHEIGTILYFSIDGLKEKIVLDPQWFIDALKSLITDEKLILEKCPAIRSKWFELKDTGKLTPELIDTVWTKENNPELHDNKEHILLLMEQLNIIARPRLYIEDGEEPKEENYFLAPCMLQQKSPVEVICPKPNDQMESSSVLCYVFVGKFLPSPIFHQLLAACVAHWPIATKKKETTQEKLIFCGCCVFQLDQHHKLTLHFREYVVFVRVTRMGIREKTPSSKLCIEVKEFITTMLLKIIGCLGQSLKFEYFIQCPEYNGDSINSLIPVSLLKENAEVHCEFHDNIIESCTLLKFWFEDQEEYGDSDASSAVPMSSPPTSDRDRFMCIAYLLNDVGSKILRKLFHHMVTHTYTLDQYLANNRSTIDSLLKKKVLNPSQMDIMFPPNGDNTNLDDYDITLLSALFNNIVPTLGQQEKNLIKSLREDRNKLYGHTKSCKMNASDFQTCWSNISSTLLTLSQQCRDPNFENEILKEIHQTRVPDASYLSILQAWFSRIERVEQRLESYETSPTSET